MLVGYRSELRELAGMLRRGDLAFFLSADLSASAGLPGWSALARSLAREVRYQPMLAEDEPITDKDVLEVIHRYKKKRRTRKALIEYLRDKLDTTNIRPSPAHQLLAQLVASLPMHTVFTTSYDNLLEWALREAGYRFHVIVDDSGLVDWDEEYIQVVKLCGDLQRPDSIVLTENDLNRYSATRQGLIGQLQTVLESKTPLFLSYGLNDPFLNRLWNALERPKYAVSFDVTALEDPDSLRQDIRLINLETRRGRDRTEAMVEWLQQLLDYTDPSPEEPSIVCPLCDISAIRELLTSAAVLNDPDLGTLIEKNFQAVYEEQLHEEQLNGKPFMGTRDQRVSRLFDHCERRGLFPKLLMVLQTCNPAVFPEYKDRIISGTPPIRVHAADEASARETSKQPLSSVLRQRLVSSCSAKELRAICFELKVDYDDLEVVGRRDKARELVAHLERYGRLSELIRVGKQLHPDVPWDSPLEVTQPDEDATPNIESERQTIVEKYLTGQVRATIELSEKYLEQVPEDEKIQEIHRQYQGYVDRFNQAWKLQNYGNRTEARKLLEQVLDELPGYADARRLSWALE